MHPEGVLRGCGGAEAFRASLSHFFARHLVPSRLRPNNLSGATFVREVITA